MAVDPYFKNGVSHLMTRNDYDYFINQLKVPEFGPDGNLFVLSKDDLDKILEDSGGDLTYIEEKLGKKGQLSEDMVRIDITDEEYLENLTVPTKETPSASDQFVPGGNTSGGIPERVAHNVPTPNTDPSASTITEVKAHYPTVDDDEDDEEDEENTEEEIVVEEEEEVEEEEVEEEEVIVEDEEILSLNEDEEVTEPVPPPPGNDDEDILAQNTGAPGDDEETESDDEEILDQNNPGHVQDPPPKENVQDDENNDNIDKNNDNSDDHGIE